VEVKGVEEAIKQISSKDLEECKRGFKRIKKTFTQMKQNQDVVKFGSILEQLLMINRRALLPDVVRLLYSAVFAELGTDEQKRRMCLYFLGMLKTSVAIEAHVRLLVVKAMRKLKRFFKPEVVRGSLWRRKAD